MLDRMKSQSDFSCIDVARGYELEGGTRQVHGEIRFSCPRHSDHKRRLFINVSKDTWYCQSCQSGGNRFELAAFLLGLEYPRDKIDVHFWLSKCTDSFSRTGLISPASRKKNLSESVHIRSKGKTLVDEAGVVILPTLARAFGVHVAAVLQTIHFFCNYYSKAECRFSVEQWSLNLSWLGERHIRRVLNDCIIKSLISRRCKGRNSFFKVNYDTVRQKLTQLTTTDIVCPSVKTVKKSSHSVKMSAINLSKAVSDQDPVEIVYAPGIGFSLEASKTIARFEK